MRERNPFGYFFLTGLLAGLFIMNLGKSILLENTGLLDENTLRQLVSMNPDSSALFVFVLRRRGMEFLLLVILATTYLGTAACVFTTLWYGFSCGTFLAAGVLRYGVKGLFFVLAGLLPQYLLYGPMLYGLLLWCDKTCRMIYRKEKAPVLWERMLSLIILLAALIGGCLLESFVNPSILKGFAKLL